MDDSQSEDGRAPNDFDEKIIAAIEIDPHLDDYKHLLSTEWCKTFSDSLRTAPSIEDAGTRLIFQWRAITRVADFPATAMHIFSSFAEGVVRRQPLADAAQPIAEAFSESFCKRAPKLARQPLFRGALQHATNDTKAKLERCLDAALSTSTPDEAWHMFVADKAFRFRVWASLQTAAVAAYNAYESFLGEPLPPQTGREGFDDRVKKHYGGAMHNRLLSKQEITVARLLRHAISHNQGRCTTQLNAVNHRLAVHDGLVSVFPGDIRRFITAMGAAAAEVVEWTKRGANA